MDETILAIVENKGFVDEISTRRKAISIDSFIGGWNMININLKNKID
jgi:hypothetical protein